MPDAEIVALLGPWSAGVLAPFSQIARILTLRFPGFTRQRRRGLLAPYTLAWRSAQKLRELGAAAAVIMRPDHWWGAMLAYLAGIPLRVGYALPGVAPFLTERLPFDPGAHSVRLNLALVERWTGAIADARASLAYPLCQEDAAYIDAYLAERGCEASQRVVAIHPGAGSAVKAWRAERWAAVADALAERLSASVVLTGAEREFRQVRAIAGRMRASPIVAVGDTNVGQLAALCARASLVLGPDSGPLHLAVAVGTPTVHLYGPADPAIYGPWGQGARHAVLQGKMGCVPCRVLDWSGDDPKNHPCVRSITVEQVLAAAVSVLS
jgi:ADP-heptose:LPS heptosyltransferase